MEANINLFSAIIMNTAPSAFILEKQIENAAQMLRAGSGTIMANAREYSSGLMNEVSTKAEPYREDQDKGA